MSFIICKWIKIFKRKQILISHLLFYDRIFVSVLEIRTLKVMSREEMCHLVFIEILGADIALIVLVIFIKHAVFAIGRYLSHSSSVPDLRTPFRQSVVGFSAGRIVLSSL